VRLSKHRIQLSDGHSVQALVAGRGVPLVVVHGFAAEGLLYAQSLSRLVSLGFKVVAIDTAGHGGTAVLPTAATSWPPTAASSAGPSPSSGSAGRCMPATRWADGW